MNIKIWKKILLGTVSLFLSLVLVLGIHIYIVTRPKPLDASTRVMARIDFKQEINQSDANKITTWLYQQKGIDHVFCNPQNKIVVFTFFPIKTSADLIVKNFKSSLSYDAGRYIPTAAELASGCPAAASSNSYKVYKFFKNLF